MILLPADRQVFLKTLERFSPVQGPKVSESVRAAPGLRSSAPGSQAPPEGSLRAESEGGTSTRLSRIAAAVARLHGPSSGHPPLIRATRTLWPGADLPSAATTTARLQAAIQHAGPFYEANVARWYRGELPRERLAVEPQMRQRRYASATQSRGADGASAPVPDDPVPEALKAIVRQQLDLLATPILRWEGEVWVGLVLTLTMPLWERHGFTRNSNGVEAPDEPSRWTSVLQMQIAELGEITARLQMAAARVQIRLSADSEMLCQLIARHRGTLVERLERLELGTVSVVVEDLHAA